MASAFVAAPGATEYLVVGGLLESGAELLL